MDRQPTKKKLEKSTKVLIWILVILICSILALLFFHLYDDYQTGHKDPEKTPGISETHKLNEKGNQQKPDETEVSNLTTISLVSQEVFDFDNVDFKFVIAKVHVKTKAPCNISLEHYKTDEGIRLDQVDSYVKTLEKNSYFVGRQNVWFSLISDKSEFDANIFIPVKDKKKQSVTISSDFKDQDDIKISLKNVNGTKEMLTYKAKDVITDGKSYEMTVSKAMDITGSYLYKTIGGDEFEYSLPSTTKVYAFKITAVSLFGDVVEIEDATFIPTSSKEQFKALDKGINAMKYTNILGSQIKEKDSGWLFFVAYNPDQNPITYKGTLNLKLKNDSNPITVNVNLN